MFSWAKQAENEVVSDNDAEDSDPIGDLLKSNTSVFGSRT
jgi:hypothetical protein